MWSSGRCTARLRAARTRARAAAAATAVTAATVAQAAWATLAWPTPLRRCAAARGGAWGRWAPPWDFLSWGVRAWGASGGLRWRRRMRSGLAAPKASRQTRTPRRRPTPAPRSRPCRRGRNAGLDRASPRQTACPSLPTVTVPRLRPHPPPGDTLPFAAGGRACRRGIQTRCLKARTLPIRVTSSFDLVPAIHL
eukprot:scaffold67444_cov55-Phaeocystis_antarctica.AAC.2